METTHKTSLNRNVVFALMLIVLLAILIHLALFNGGIRGSDAYAYSLHAYQIQTGQYHLADCEVFYAFRYLILLLTALSYKIFGIGDFSASLFPLIASALNTIVVFLLGTRMYGPKIGLLGALLVALYPMDILFASLVSPDSFIPVLASLSVLFYLMGYDEQRRVHRTVFVLLSGLMIGIATGVRETSVFLFAALAVYQALRDFRRLKPLILVFAGLCIPVCAELAFYYFNTGDLFFRSHRTAGAEALVKGADPDAVVSLLFYPKVMFGFDRTGLATYGLMWWLAAGGLFLSLLRKVKKGLLPVLWLVIPFLGFEFGTQSIRELIPIMKNYNYLSLLTTPAALLGAYFLYSILDKWFHGNKRKQIAVAALFFVLLGSMNLYGAYRLSGNIRNDAAPYVAVSDALKKESCHIVYSHHFRWPLFLAYFLKYDPSYDFRSLDGLDEKGMASLPGACIVLHQRYLTADTAGRSLTQSPWYTAYLSSPPESWHRVVEFNGHPAYNRVVLYRSEGHPQDKKP